MQLVKAGQVLAGAAFKDSFSIADECHLHYLKHHSRCMLLLC